MLDHLKSLAALLIKHHLMVATAESCTAGLVAKLMTDQAGSSQWFERGFVTYSNAAKREMLSVSEATIIDHGAVSVQTVTAMAAGALENSHANVTLAVSGIAGPDGGSKDKPVGTVWFAWQLDGAEGKQQKIQFSGDRDAVRQQAAEHAIQGLFKYLMSHL